MDVVDFIGQKIKLGDTVVYPVRRRSTMTLKKATVCEVPGNHVSSAIGGISCLKEDGQRVVLRHPTRCIVVNRMEKA